MNELDNRNIRERQIAIMLRLYYDRFPALQKESLEDFTKNNLNAYLNSDLSIDDINDHLAKKYMKQKDDDDENRSSLDEMINPLENTNEAEKKEEKGIQYIKKDNKKSSSSSDGYISNMIITTLTLITFSLCCIGLIILYLIK